MSSIVVAMEREMIELVLSGGNEIKVEIGSFKEAKGRFTHSAAVLARLALAIDVLAALRAGGVVCEVDRGGLHSEVQPKQVHVRLA